LTIVDTGALLALFNRREPQHEEVAGHVTARAGSLVVSPFVVAELDYLLATRIGVEAELAALAELGSGAYELPAMTKRDLVDATAVIVRYRDQSIGIADASLVVLAERFETLEILTLDRRRFSVLRPIRGGRFRLVP
jgi:uncharacterized protein